MHKKLCPICGEPLGRTSSGNILKTCGNKECSKKMRKITTLAKYGVENVNQSKEIKKKKEKTCLEKYGVENPLQSKEVRDKGKKTCIKKYGVEHPSQSEIVKEKKKETVNKRYGVNHNFQINFVKKNRIKTWLEKYGVENPAQSYIVQAKMKKTCLEKFGVENPFQSKEVRDKGKKTCIKKYGVEHPSQNSEWFENAYKGRCKYKPYKFPSGKEVKIQGYENKFLDEYFSYDGCEDNIIVSVSEINNKLGIIWYYGPDGKKHRYYPDFYLIKENKIIEVKSTYTITCNKMGNELKKQACLDMGLNFEYKIY